MVYYYARNGTGDVTGLFTDPNTIAEGLTYDAWGAVPALGGSHAATLGVANRLQWKSAMWEGDSTQLYYVNARYRRAHGGAARSDLRIRAKCGDLQR